jgi:hypothetical protein
MCTAGVFLERKAAVAWRWPLTSYSAEDKNQNTYRVGYAATNIDATTNAEEYYRPT